MQVSLESTGSLGRKLTVQVPSELIEGEVSSRIKNLGQQVRLKGFRPGKVPYKVLEQRYGKQVRQEVVGEMIQRSFQDAIVKEKLRPAGAPEINANPPAPNADLEYTASFEVYPELNEFNVDDLAVERPVATVSEEDIDRMIETLREQRRSWNDVERPAAEGDLVFFHYVVEAGDERFPAEDRERAGAILGRGAFDADFEKALEGAEAGKDSEFELSFAESFREPGLAGKSGKVTVSIEKIQESELPEVDQEFAASFGVTEGGMDAFREDVRRNMERELNANLSRKLRSSVLEALVAAFPDLDVPVRMVDEEIAGMQREAAQQAERMGIENPDVPTADELREPAERRVRAALLVSEIARHGQIQLDQGRLRDMVNDVASTYENPQAIVELYYSDERLLSNVQNVVLEEQAVEWVLERAKVESVEKTFDQVMRPNA